MMTYVCMHTHKQLSVLLVTYEQLNDTFHDVVYV